MTAPKKLVRGRFVTARPGFGFVKPDSGGEDIFVPARYAQEAMPGDEVAVSVIEKGKFGKPEGRVERIVKKGRTVLLGLYKERSGAPFLQPFDSLSQDDLPLKSRGRLHPKPGMIVEVDRAALTVTCVLGRPEDPGVDAQVVIRRYGLRPEFGGGPAEPRPSRTISHEALEERQDFRDWASVTIDGEKAQDFDDAVSIRLPVGLAPRRPHRRYLALCRPGSALDRGRSAGHKRLFPRPDPADAPRGSRTTSAACGPGCPGSPSPS
jgi:ribonuclease R